MNLNRLHIAIWLHLAIWVMVLAALTIESHAQSSVSGGQISGGIISFGTGTNCGPPTYSCSLNSTQTGGKNIIQLPSTPNMGNVTGAGTVVTPTDFNNPVCRLTDENFDPSQQNVNFVANAGGSGDETLSSKNSTFWVVGQPSGRAYPIAVSFTGGTCTVQRLYASNPSWSATGGWYLTVDDPGWSYATDTLLFIVDANNPAIDSYNVSGWTPTGTPPSNVPVFDFRAGQTGSWGTTSSNCLPSGYTMNWSSYGKQNKFTTPDQIFGLALSNAFVFHSSSAPSGTYQLNETVTDQTTGATFVFHELSGNNPIGNNYTGTANVGDVLKGNTSGATITLSATGVTAGGQDTGTDAVGYKVGSGCVYLNTATGTITGDWGTTGTVTGTTDRFTIHNAKLSKDGSTLLLALGICLSGSCSTVLPYQWNFANGTLYPITTSGSGHWTEGTSTIVNNSGSPHHFQMVTRAFGNGTTPTNVPMGLPWPPGDCSLSVDQHPDWANTNSTDTLPWLTSSYNGSAPTGSNPFTCVLEDEIFAVLGSSGTVWRFAHTFNTDQSPIFSTSIAVGSVSQDGQFYLWSSDWQGTLGGHNTSGSTRTTGCTIGAAVSGNYCIGDVFIVPLR